MKATLIALRLVTNRHYVTCEKSRYKKGSDYSYDLKAISCIGQLQEMKGIRERLK